MTTERDGGPVDDINPEDIGVEVSRMWTRLARQYAAAIPDHVISGQFELAMRLAWMAEAAYWQASGDADTPTVAKILRDADAMLSARTRPNGTEE